MVFLFYIAWPLLLALLVIIFIAIAWFFYKAKRIIRDNNSSAEEQYVNIDQYEKVHNDAEVIDAEFEEKEIK